MIIIAVISNTASSAHHWHQWWTQKQTKCDHIVCICVGFVSDVVYFIMYVDHRPACGGDLILSHALQTLAELTVIESRQHTLLWQHTYVCYSYKCIRTSPWWFKICILLCKYIHHLYEYILLCKYIHHNACILRTFQIHVHRIDGNTLSTYYWTKAYIINNCVTRMYFTVQTSTWTS